MDTVKMSKEALQLLNDFFLQTFNAYHFEAFNELTGFQKALCQYTAYQLEYCDVEESGNEIEMFTSLLDIFEEEAKDIPLVYHEFISKEYFQYSYLDIYRFTHQFYIEYILNWGTVADYYQDNNQRQLPF